jgi:ribonuclease P protein component
MLPKNRRIPRKSFPAYRDGKVYRNKLFLLRISSKALKNSLFCVSVSKKTAKSAVLRNKLRRAGYKAIENRLSEIIPGHIAIFSFQNKPESLSEIEPSIASLLKESKLIK